MLFFTHLVVSHDASVILACLGLGGLWVSVSILCVSLGNNFILLSQD